MFTIFSSVFSGILVFLQVFQTYVSNVFRRMLQLLHLDVSKLDRVLHFFPRLSAVSPRCQAWEASTGEGSSHRCGRPLMLADVRSSQNVDGQTRDVRHGAAAWTSGR
jgi:hypothetical protein